MLEQVLFVIALIGVAVVALKYNSSLPARWQLFAGILGVICIPAIPFALWNLIQYAVQS